MPSPFKLSLCLKRRWVDDEERQGTLLILGGKRSDRLHACIAILGEFGIACLTHKGDKFMAIGDIDGFASDVGLGICGAVPRELGATISPCESLVLTDYRY